MRLLFAIPHFFQPRSSRHGSGAKSHLPRLRALRACLTALHETFCKEVCVLDHARRGAFPVGHCTSSEPRTVICTAGNNHLLNELADLGGLFEHHAADAQADSLGFACQALLRDNLGKYDYYCYLEDDIIVSDPWLFQKLAWFDKTANDCTSLLQPNRFEADATEYRKKLYPDGPLAGNLSLPLQPSEGQLLISAVFLGLRIHFARTVNPHAGCYFLNAEQMEHWSKQPHFLDRDTSFIGPLESAATLGIMKTFRVFKPAYQNAHFLEVRHYGSAYLSQIERRLPILPPLLAAHKGTSSSR